MTRFFIACFFGLSCWVAGKSGLFANCVCCSLYRHYTVPQFHAVNDNAMAAHTASKFTWSSMIQSSESESLISNLRVLRVSTVSNPHRATTGDSDSSDLA